MQPLPIKTLVNAQCELLGLSTVELVERMGYKNRAKGLRRLQDLTNFAAVSSGQFLHALSAALDTGKHDIELALSNSKQILRERELAKWDADFKPHAVIQTAHDGRPKQIGIAAMIGAMSWRTIEFASDLSESNYLTYALKQYSEREHRISVFFCAPMALAINVRPDRCLRYSLSGEFIEELHRAVRLGQIQIRF